MIKAGEHDARTANEYEMLRDYATEAGEAHDGIEDELAVFMAHGAAKWLRLCKQHRVQGRGNRKKTAQGLGLGLLAILLANMMESRGGT